MTLSLLKDTEEFKNLKIPAHPYTKHENHPLMDWIRVEHSKYSQRFSDSDPKFDELVVKAACLFFKDCKSKSKLLKIANVVDLIWYFDVNFYKIPQSKEHIKEFFDKLETVVIKSQPVEGFAWGMRFEQSINEITADMTDRQSKDMKKEMIDFFNAMKYVHYELGLNGKFIPIKDYFDVRAKEGAWIIFFILMEYGLEISLTETILRKIEIKRFLNQINQYYLTMGDSFDFKTKLARNDISAHIISYSASNFCSLQESVDMNDIIFLKSQLRARESQNSILKNDILNSSEVQQFMNGLLDLANGMHQLYYEDLGFENKDGFIYHKNWENLLK